MRAYARLGLKPLIVLSLIAVLAACGGEEKPAAEMAAAPALPAEVITASVQSLKKGDLLTALKLTVPPEQVEKIKAGWKKEKAAQGAPAEKEQREFAAMMAKVTGPDAEAVLYAELEPQLTRFDTDVAPQLPLWAGIGRGFAVQQIQQNKELTPEQKTQMTQSVDVLVNWAQTTPFSDRERAKAAIAEVVKTARTLDLKTLDQLRALEFEPMLVKAGTAFVGLKSILALYGLNLDAMLDSVRPQVVSQEGDKATVKVDYQLFDKPISFQAEMVQIGDRWYGKQMIEAFNKANQPAAAKAAGTTDEPSAEDAGEGEEAPADSTAAQG